MSQKSYRMEIVESLLKRDNHIRRLAKELKTNQMMVLRKIKEIEKSHVIIKGVEHYYEKSKFFSK